MNDLRQRFYFLDGPVRGEIVRLEKTIADTLGRHAYPAPVRALLAELMAAAVLLTATLKLEGRLSLQARGDGRLRMIMAECTHLHDVRAIARLDDDDDGAGIPDHVSLRELLGHGTLAITLEPALGERYQGIVPLEQATLAGCLEDYFARSEQIPTRLWLQADTNRAAGLMLQVMPDTGQPDADLWPRATGLADTLRDAELLDTPPRDMLYRLYHEEQVELPEAGEVRFACSCSRERTAEGLVSIGQAEAEDIVAEQGEIRLICQFCNAEYVFTPEQVRALFHIPLH